MATAQNCYTLTSYYEKKFKEKYGVPVKPNKYQARWGFDAMLQGGTMDAVKELIDYYFTTKSPRRHDLGWFFNNYDHLAEAKEEHEKDSLLRTKLRAESEERAKRWEERIGNQRSTGN